MGRRRRRRIMPWGKYKGVHIVHVPEDYLSWLDAECAALRVETWGWLRLMVQKELRKRGLRVAAEDTPIEAATPEVIASPFERAPRRFLS